MTKRYDAPPGIYAIAPFMDTTRPIDLTARSTGKCKPLESDLRDTMICPGYGSSRSSGIRSRTRHPASGQSRHAGLLESERHPAAELPAAPRLALNPYVLPVGRRPLHEPVLLSNGVPFSDHTDELIHEPSWGR